MATQSTYSKPIEGDTVNDFRLPDETHIGYVHLQVSDLKRSLLFYETLLGMKRTIEVTGTVVLSASGKSPYHILLTEHPGARPKPARSTGLYHVAIRFPSRRELAKAFHRLYVNNTAFQGFSDHLVSEAIYMADPDGNGIELYADRPRAKWIMQENQVQMATIPLDIDNLLSELTEESSLTGSLDPSTDIGHVHLHVSDLQSADEFYHNLLGFDVTQRSYPGALFLSAGGYHHHIGVNTWAGKGAPPPPSDAAGLLSFGIFIPTPQSMQTIARRFEEYDIGFELQQHEILPVEVLRVKSPDDLRIEFFSN
ncbi:MAG: VOC family protein [Bacteroidota bacterium]